MDKKPKTPKIYSFFLALKKTSTGHNTMRKVHDAIRIGDVAWLRSCGASINMLNVNNENAMHIAAQSGQLKVVEFLYKRFPRMMCAKTNRDQTVLHFAVQSQQLAIVKFCVRCSIEQVDLEDDAHFTPLQQAVQSQFEEAVKLMIDAKPSIRLQTTPQHYNLLHLAVMSQHLSMVQYLISVCPSTFLTNQENYISTPLHIAVCEKSLAVVVALAEAGPHAINLVDKITGYTPVLQTTDFNILMYLLQVVPDAIRHKSEGSNQNLLHRAVLRVDNTINFKIHRLLKLCPDLLKERDCWGNFPFNLCVRNCDETTILRLLDYKPVLFGTTGFGNTVLHDAVIRCSFNIVLRLLKASPYNLECVNYNAKTPLCLAIQRKSRDVVELFQPHITVEHAVALRCECLQNLHIDLLSTVVQELNHRLIPDIATLVVQFLETDPHSFANGSTV